MKRFIGLFAVVMVLVIAACCIGAGGTGVVKHTVWVIPYDFTNPLTVAPGDIIELRTTRLPLIADNLGISFNTSVTATHNNVEQIGSGLPHREGTMERSFFYKAFDAGAATLSVSLLNADKTVRQTWSYKVVVKKPGK
jgi:hypothetical protein